jgi:preprotein translocase subunit SecD
MNRAVLYRVGLLAALVVVSLVLLAPSMPGLGRLVPEWWHQFLGARQIRLGLDLRGGSHLLFTVELEKAIEIHLDRKIDEVRREIREAQVGAVALVREGEFIKVTLANPGRRAEVERILGDRFPSLVVEGGPTGDQKTMLLTLHPREVEQLHEYALDQSLETIRNRIDEFGVAEPTIQRQGSQEILIQLPGIQEPDRAKALIGRTAVLEFRLLADTPQYQGFGPENPAPGTEAMDGIEGDPVTGRTRRTSYLVESKIRMTGESIADARMQLFDQLEGPVVQVTLDGDGARRFDELTAANVGRRLAIVLDGTVYSAPVIQERIPGGRAQITGNFNMKEARDLAIVLRAGALPAPVTLIEERTVGPALGRDSIRQGVVSFAVGGAAVALFVLVYYRFGGALAVGALMLNIVYLLGALAGFGATLTLPGIGGIVLTLGMAVDANVLISERIREELRLGKAPRGAIDAGYERAWSAIFDSNLTTFMSGLILFQFGTGPVKGFAVTLCIGIVTSVFTAVFGTRTAYEYLLSGRRLSRVSI